LASDEAFKKFLHRSPDMMSQGDSNRERIMSPLLLVNHLQTVCKQTLLSNTPVSDTGGGMNRPTLLSGSDVVKGD